MSNSYVDITYANEYFTGRLFGADWFSQPVDQREQAITQSTLLIDALNYQGCKTDPDQELEFPRNGDTEVPKPIKEASCEIALALAKGVDLELQAEEISITSQRVSGFQTNYDTDKVNLRKVAGIPSQVAWLKIYPYLSNQGEVKVSRIN